MAHQDRPDDQDEAGEQRSGRHESGQESRQQRPGQPDNAFRPFDNDTQVMTFTDGDHELSLENGPDAVLLAGQLDLSADEAGLRQVRALREALGRIEAAIRQRIDVERDAPDGAS